MFEQGDLFAVFLIFLLVIILWRQKEHNPAGYIVITLSLFCFCSTHTVVFSVNGILSKHSHCWIFKKIISPKSYWQNTLNYAMIGVERRPGITFCLLLCLIVCESRLKKQIMKSTYKDEAFAKVLLAHTWCKSDPCFHGWSIIIQLWAENTLRCPKKLEIWMRINKKEFCCWIFLKKTVDHPAGHSRLFWLTLGIILIGVMIWCTDQYLSSMITSFS